MSTKEKETMEVIENTIEKLQDAFYAVNNLAIKTRVSLSGWDLEYYNAMDLLKGWLNNLKKED